MVEVYFGSAGFWGVVGSFVSGGVTVIVVGVRHAPIPETRRVCFGIGIFMVIIAATLVIWAPAATGWGAVTFTSPEPDGMKIETTVETAPSLPDINERVIVNPEPAEDLVKEWDTLPPEDKQEKFKDLLDEPDTRVWTKPEGSDTYAWFHWDDLLPDDKQSVLERIPELSPMYEF